MPKEVSYYWYNRYPTKAKAKSVASSMRKRTGRYAIIRKIMAGSYAVYASKPSVKRKKK